MKKILIALSGGVDSSVAAGLLLEAGHEVHGVYMRTWMHEETPFAACPWKEDREAAAQAAETLKIPFETINLINAYQEHVVRALVEGYRNGITPNPDILCNQHIKFGMLLDYARENGFDGLATGHYCRLQKNETGYSLWESPNKDKDQSYFLARVRRDALPLLHFPVGELSKAQVREKARALGLGNAERKDSQGICFLGKIPIQKFLQNYIPQNPGPIVTLDGRCVGEHPGLHAFTLGQRRGIGVPSNTDHKAYTVVGKDLLKNTLIVAFDEPQLEALYKDHTQVAQLHWLAPELSTHTAFLGKPRFRDPSTPLTLIQQPDGRAHVQFSQPQRALASGQVLTLYIGEQLVGSGLYV